MDNDQLAVFIEEDKRTNPSCHYSQTHNESCRSINGQFICEVLTRITRICPGKQPEDIYKNSSTENGEASSSSSAYFGKSDGGNRFDPFLNNHGTEDPFSVFESILKDFNHSFGSLQQHHPHTRQPPPLVARPDRGRPPLFDPFQHFDDDQGDVDSVKKPSSKAARDGHVTGPIERI